MNKKSTSKKRPVVARKVEQVVGRDFDALLRIVSISTALEQWMFRYVGMTDEWPIQIIASTPFDEMAAVQLCDQLSDLRKAIKAMKRSGPAFRALMGWQARKAYPPNPNFQAGGTL